MRCISIENPGPDSRLLLEERDIPDYTATQLLVRVAATAINRADLLQRQGKYPPPVGESDIPGLELAGDVVAVGSKVTGFCVGDRVYGLVASGAYAEYCPVEASLAHPIPSHIDYTTAACLPEALTTCYATLFDLGQLHAQQTLLIHGAGSGIASLGIQMAKQAGARVVTTVGNADKVAPALALGADEVIAYKEQDFEQILGACSVDVIVDFIGGDYCNKHLHLLKPKGRLIQIASMKGSRAEIDLSQIIRKRLCIQGFVLRAQSIIDKAKLWELAHQHWFESITNQHLKPVIDSEYPLEHIQQAHDRMQTGPHFGKIAIRMNPYQKV